MTFSMLGWISAAIFFLIAGSWFLVIERERRRDERIRKELQENVERLEHLSKGRGLIR